MTAETTDFADFTEIFSFCPSLCHWICCCFLLFVCFFFSAPLSQLSSLGRCFCCFFFLCFFFLCFFFVLLCFLVVSLAPLS